MKSIVVLDIKADKWYIAYQSLSYNPVDLIFVGILFGLELGKHSFIVYISHSELTMNELLGFNILFLIKLLC